MTIDTDVLMEKLQDAAAHKGLGAAIAGILIQFIETLPIVDATPVVHGWWEWNEVWLPSTPEHPAECEECGWRCGRCKNTLENMVGGYWDDPFEKPKLKYCPECGAKMDLEETY